MLSCVQDEGVSPLGAVVSFLYSYYILGYTALSIGIGRFFDRYNAQGNPERVRRQPPFVEAHDQTPFLVFPARVCVSLTPVLALSR